MTENRKNWLYPEASGLYFPHDGFVMRATDGKQYDYEEECELLNEYHKGYNELKKQNKELKKENEQLKQALLFFVDVANAECSSNWREDMEKDCQKLFNCSYKEAQEKYDNYDSRWWELE